jgi:hypothetical protein
LTAEVQIKSIFKIYIGDMTYYDNLDKILKRWEFTSAATNSLTHVCWCDGYILDYIGFNETEYMQKLRIENDSYYIKYLICAKMPVFKDRIELKGGGFILVSDTSEELISSSIIKHVKEVHP